jgi:RNA polymerase sigma-70 factor (ECF subfamily)
MTAASHHTVRPHNELAAEAGEALVTPGGLTFAGPAMAAGAHASAAGAGRDAALPASDATVIEESLHHPERFGEIYRRYFADIYGYVASRLGSDAADDLAAETFLAAFRRRHSFDPDLGAVRPWLYGIATNVLAEHRRAESRRYRMLGKVSPDPDHGGYEDRIAERLSAASQRRPLARALTRLSARDRDVLLLVALGDLSYAEVAFALSIPAGTVGSRLSRARRKLAGALGGVNPAADNEHPGKEGQGNASTG